MIIITSKELLNTLFGADLIILILIICPPIEKWCAGWKRID